MTSAGAVPGHDNVSGDGLEFSEHGLKTFGREMGGG